MDNKKGNISGPGAPKKDRSILDQAREFLDTQMKKKEFVIDYKKIPSQNVREFLKAHDYLYSPCKYMYIIKDNKTPNNQVLDQNYFNIVSKLSKGSILGGALALNHHVGKITKVDTIDIITQTKNGEMSLGDNEKYVVRYQKSEKWRDVQQADINGSKVLIETPTSYLINHFSENTIKNEDFKILMNTTNFMLNDIENFIEKGASITGLSRMALWYKNNENPRNYSLIKTAIKKGGKRINYSKEIGTTEDTKIIDDLFSSSINYGEVDVGAPDKSPKIVRFENLINKLDKQCLDYLTLTSVGRIPNITLNVLLSNIENNVVNDSYHSLTIEDYHVSKKDIDILNDLGGREEESKIISDKIAIKGYLNSYKITVDQIKEDYGTGAKISKSFMGVINNGLFKYDSEAKNFKLDGDYRSHNVQITGCKHIPPNHKLVDEYMEVFTDYINKLEVKTQEDKIRKAIMTHYLFVYIHPYGDGNGRTGRFLMNHALGSDKMDWITILSEKREEYISSLRKGQENDDIVDFTKVIIDYLT